MLCEGLQWPDAIFGAGSNPRSRDMRRLTVVAAAGLVWAFTAGAADYRVVAEKDNSFWERAFSDHVGDRGTYR